MGDYNVFRSAYRNFTHRKVLFIIACVVLVFVTVGLALSIGDYHISFLDSYRVLYEHLTGAVRDTQLGHKEDYIIWELRTPRAIGTVAVGATLAVCGVAMQSAMKNPLADPYTAGISSGASMGVALLTIWGVSLVPFVSYDLQTVINAFVFSLVPMAVILFFCQVKKASPTRMILTGIGVMYMFSATTSLMMLLADPDDLADVYRWNLGNLGAISWSNLPFMVGSAVISTGGMMLLSDKLNILSLDDNAVQSLGMNPNRMRLFILLIVSITTALVVSFTGTIGFVGLVVPHIVRMVIGSDGRYLIPASAVFGGVFILVCDLIAKSVVVAGLPVGVITSIIGGPLFVYVLLKSQARR
ncbi:MAG: iron ABC transporter permease [archaeon]|nr:iron ABC transporter permease [archaeon]